MQTVASAAGTLSSIIFVLPGLVMIGWWTGFPYWVSFAICALGGTLGVMYSIPLRRALVTQSDLPYPEGVACAEVLKVGGGEQRTRRRWRRAVPAWRAVLWGSIVSAVVRTASWRRAIFASDVVRILPRRRARRHRLRLPPVVRAVRGRPPGRTVGGLAMLVGALIGWVWGVPHFSALSATDANLLDSGLDALAHDTWSHKVRFVGAGTIGVAAVWTLAKLVKPVVAGLRSAMARLARARGRQVRTAAAHRAGHPDRPGWAWSRCCACCRSASCWRTSLTAAGSAITWCVLVVSGVLYIAIMSFFVSAVCGYMAGPHRLLEQPAVRHRHPGRDRRRAAAGVRRARRNRPRTSGKSPGRLRAVRDRGGVHRRGDRQQQPAGPEDRAAGRCHAVEAAGGAGDRRDRRRGDHPADPRPAQPRLRLRRRPRTASRASAAGAAGGADLGPGAGRHPEQRRLEPDRDRRRDRRGHHHRGRYCCAG